MVSTIERQILQSQVMDRIQQVQQQHPDMQQHYFGIQFNEDRRKSKSKVNESEKSNQVRVGEEERRKQDREQGERGPTEHAADDQTPGVEKPHDHIDIKV